MEPVQPHALVQRHHDQAQRRHAQRHARPVTLPEADRQNRLARKPPADQQPGQQRHRDELPIHPAPVEQGIGPLAGEPDRQVRREGGGHREQRQAVQAYRQRQELQRRHHQQRDQRAAAHALQEAQEQHQFQVAHERQRHRQHGADAEHPQVETPQRQGNGEPGCEWHGHQFAGGVGGGEPGRVVQREAERATQVGQRQRADAVVQTGHHRRDEDADQGHHDAGRQRGGRPACGRRGAGSRYGRAAHGAVPADPAYCTASGSQPPPSALYRLTRASAAPVALALRASWLPSRSRCAVSTRR